MTHERKVIKEFDHAWMGKYVVEQEHNGWDWRYHSSWETKAAAYYAAEELSSFTGDKTRVLA